MRRTDYSDPGLVVAPSSGRWQVQAGRTLLVVIAAAAIAFFVWQWLLAPPVSASNPGAPLAATPALVYSSEDTPGEIDLGESFELEIEVAEYSGQGDRGGISVSFPGLTNTGGNSSSYDSTQGKVETISYTNGVSMVTYHDQGDQIYKGTDSSTSAADYLLVESDDGDWPSRTGDDYAWRTLKLRATPKETGEFKVYFRFWLCGDRYQECDRRPRPEHSDQDDQQRWAVYVITVDVTNPVTETGEFARDPDEDFDTLDDAGNDSPEGIWSDGTTMWVADSSDDKIYAYNLSTKARDSDKDFDTLDDAGNDSPEGIWSDGTTMWVADSSDEKIYAYNLSTKARDSDKDFNTLEDAENEGPKGIWSDGTTMWVADYSDDKIYAYDLDSKGRVSSKDFNTLEDAENERAEGIWSDGATMWVADYHDDKIYAYNLNTKARVSSKDFDTLEEADNESPAGLWSDRTTVWVADSSDSKIYAYDAPEMAPAPVISNRVPAVSKVTPTSASVSLYVGNSQTFEASANDPDDNLISWDWSIDGTSEDSGRFEFLLIDNSPTGTVTKEFTRTFSSAGTYTVEATFTDKGGRSGSVTWTVEVINRAPVISSASPSSSHVLLTMGGSQTFAATVSDADNNLKSWDWSVDVTSEDSGNWGTFFSPTPTGSVTKSFSHTFSAVGGYRVRATFADTDGDSDSQEWMVQVVQESGDYERDSDKDFNTLDAAGNGSPAGIWSDGTTMWVADSSDDKIYAYNLSTKARDSAKDFITLEDAGNDSPEGIWSDETTMWVADSSDDKIYAYNLSAKARDSAKDFNTLDAAGNEGPAGIWSDGTTMWVADYSDEKIYAYNLSTKARDSAKDFNTLEDAGNDSPEGIWSDETTMWVVDYSDDKIYAYNLSTKAWDFGKDFNTLDAAGNEGPAGIWSDGTTMWVVDYSDDKIYAYDGPGTAGPTQPEPTNSPPVISNATPSPSSTVSLTAGDSQTFEATVSDPDNNLKSWDWSVDGRSEDSGTWGTLFSSTPAGSVTKSFSHTFSGVGTYTVKATFTDAEGDSDSEEWTVQVTGQDQAIYRWSNLGVTLVEIAATCESNLASVGIGEDVTFTSRVAGMVTPLNSSITIYMKPIVKETLRGIDAPDSLKTGSASIGVGDEVTLTYEGGTVHPGEYEFGCRFYWEQAGPLPDSELTTQGSSPSINRVSVDRGWGIYSGSNDTGFTNCGAVNKTRPFLVGEDVALQAKGNGNKRIPGYYFGLLFIHHDGTLIDGLFGHKIGTGFRNSELVSGTHAFDSPGEHIVDCELHYQGGVWVPYNPLEDPEEKAKKLVEMLIVIYFKPERLIDTTLQVALREFIGVTSTRLTVVEARWGTAGLNIERGTEMLLDGRERIRVRVSREEKENRAEERVAAPDFHIDGPELGQTKKEATRCVEGDQDHDKYLSLCWETTFDIPVNDTINPRDYSVRVESHLIKGVQTSIFTVIASPDKAGLRAFYDATGGPNWSNKNGWLSSDPIGDWYGVDTNAGGRVVKLDLRGSGQRGNGLQGPLPSDLKDTLPFLDTLYLAGNGGLTECVREDLLLGVPANDLTFLDLPTCEDTCAWGGALPDPNNQGLVADCEALLAARDTLSAGRPGGRLNWSTREPIGTWRGVVRDGNPERVIRLEIEQPPRLWGYISREIAKLSGLQVLTLANAGLRGEIPEELKDLASLNTLNLQGNQLNGGIPRELSGLTSLHTLDLSENDLNRPIPRNLTELVNLQTLRLDGNQFSGCIPEGLRGVANNDLGDLGLPFCDVLLSGLTISPGVLTPRFESGRTDYTAEVGVSRITVTPTNSHNATFMFLDENGAPIPDADGTLVGHQVELGNGVTTIGVKVLSPDAGASHTYTIQVSRGGSLPDAPAIVVPITPGAAFLTVSWTAPPGETGITSYDLRYIESGSQPDANWTVEESVWTSGSGSLNYQITGLANGTQYDVQVRTVNAAGHGFWSAIATGTPRTTPGSPVIDSLGPGDSTLAVEWSAPATDGGAEVAGYDLRFIPSDAPDKADANWTGRNNIWSSGTLRHDLGGLTNGIGYDVQVRGVNPAGHGLWSTTAAGTPLTTPGAPAIDSLGPGDGALTVEWSAPATDGGAEVAGYDLRFIPSDAPDKADANWTGRNNIWSSDALRYDLGGLTNGVSHDVLVRAVNAVGHGPWSPAATGTPRTTPGAPVIDSLIPGDGALTVEWSDPATDGGADVTGYDLRYIRSDAPDRADANWTVRSSIWSSGTLQYDLGGLTDGVGYDVQVRAANAAGHGQWSGSITVTPHTMPTAPAIVSVAAGDGALTISWTAPTDTGGLNIQGYDVRYIPVEENSRGATWTEEQDVWTLGSLEHTVTGLTNGVRYDLELRAVTSAGDGPWSPTFSGTPKTTPDAPIISLIIPDGSTLTVAWNAPANTGGSAVTSYDLRYIESGAIDKADANWTEEVPAWSTGPLSYAFGSLTGGTPYDVQVRAVNAAGPGLWSATFAGTPVTIRASRSFSPAPVSAGGELEVTITAVGYGGFGGVVETLPIGFSYVSSSLSDSAVTVAGQEVSFTLFGDTAFTYTVAAPSAGGTYSFTGVLKNSNTVEQPVGGVSSITVEAGALSVSITRSATTLVRLGTAIPVTATFGAPVSGFTVEDVSVTNGVVSNFAGSRADYTFDATPNAIGKVTVDIAAGAATDAGGNGNTAASQLSLGIPYDDDGDGAIEKAEVIEAINDYLFGAGDEAISKAEVIELINAYLFG